MHLTYIPVVQSNSKRHGEVNKINCSEFWKGFNSYGKLQDDFYKFVIQRGFDLKRGERIESQEEKRQHLSVEDSKLKTAQSKAADLISESQKLQGEIAALQQKIITLEEQFKGRKLTTEELS
jgi:heterodisulfide reductase subunit A-like polyferredoxin